MNMLDRVADAIRCAVEEEDAEAPWEYLTDRAKEPWRKKARSVLTSMAVLDETLALVGAEAYDGADPCDSAMEAMGAAWSGMINAAMEGK